MKKLTTAQTWPIRMMLVVCIASATSLVQAQLNPAANSPEFVELESAENQGAPNTAPPAPLPAGPEQTAPDPVEEEEANVSATTGVATALPVVSVETTGPPEVNVGKTARFKIVVTNLGDTIVRGAFIEIVIPSNARLLATNPPVESLAANRIRMNMGELQPKDKQFLDLEMVPQARGQIDLSTKVGLSAITRIAVQVKQPELTVTAVRPETTIYGNTVDFKVIVRNIGDGPAEDVRVSHILPEGVTSRPGVSKSEIGWLAPGESREVVIPAVARTNGVVEAEFVASSADGLEAKARTQLTIRRPMLEVDASGPAISYMRRSGVYAVLVTNPGDATARNVVVYATIPEGLKIQAVDRPVQFDKNTNTIRWQMERLAAGGNEVLRFKAQAIHEGEMVHEVVATADHGLSTDIRFATEVISRADLSMQIADTPGPVEVGGVATFEVVLKNRGTKAARNVQVRVVLPESLSAVSSAEYAAAEGEVEFPALTLPEGEEKVLRFQAVGSAAGDHVVKAVLRCDSMTREVSTEEIVFFYESSGRRVATPTGGSFNRR